jgi:hypothetical protein
MSMRLLPFLPCLVLALTLFLGACATTAPMPPQATGPDPAAQPAQSPAPSPRGREAKLEGPAPDTLIGSDQDGIVKLVGAPGLVRRERGVEVWQYAPESCVLLLYFYDDKAGARKLTYLEAMPKGAAGAGNVTQAGCLSEQIRTFKAKDLG